MDTRTSSTLRLSPFLKERIISLHKAGLNQVEIRKLILEVDKICISRQTINKLIVFYKRNGSILKPKCKTRRVPKLSEDHFRFIDTSLQENNELTSADLTRLLKQVFGVKVSQWTVRLARKKLGWSSKSTQYCQTIRNQNKGKRFAYAVKCVKEKDNFNNVIFTDESTIKIQTSTRRTLYKDGERRLTQQKGKPKHPFQLHVWAGISRKGATNIHIFTGIMDSLYFQEILRTSLVPFINRNFTESHRLMQDNDPKHVSRSTVLFMEEQTINHWPTPPESPDMNPIENLWAGLKHYIRKVKKPTKKDELIAGIKEFWATVTPDMCNRYINHLYKVIPEVIRARGGPSGY